MRKRVMRKPKTAMGAVHKPVALKKHLLASKPKTAMGAVHKPVALKKH